jgi:hypothetical protein
MKRALLIILLSVALISCGGKSSKDETAKTKDPSKSEVLICGSKSAYAYHSHECKGLSRCKSEVKKMTLSQAKEKGYKPCGFCYGK